MTGIWGVKYGNSKTTEVTTIIKKSGRSGQGKGRSLKTYQNKLRKIERYYNRMVKDSKKQKAKTPKNKKGVFFCDKYPTFKQYIKILTIKKARI